MLVAIFAAAIAIFAAVVVQDLRQRQVSNLLCAGIAGLGIIRWAILMQIPPAAWAIAAALAVFGIGILFNARGWLGGGDVKLISACTLLLGAESGQDLLFFFFLLSLIGSVLAIVLLIQLQVVRRWSRRAGNAAAPELPGGPPSDHEKVPYAVAVAVAAAIVLFLQVQRA